MEKLLECPCCGGEADIEEIPSNPFYEDLSTHYSIGCKKCNIGWYVNTKEEAIAAWNRRPSPSTAPLTLEHGFDITNADGTPIDYDALGRKYKDKLCYCDIDGFYIGEDGQLVLMDDCGTSVSVDRGDYHIEARKPEEGE